jgi:hypothetical protein
MLYTNFTVKDKEYKARLTTRVLIDLERKMGTNPINILASVGANGEVMPKIEPMLDILHASLQAYEHNIKITDVYDLYDSWLEEGKTAVDLVQLIVKICQDSGLIPNEEEIEKNVKRGK